MKINYCCGEKPIIWECKHDGIEFCGCEVEKIECPKCGRIIWGADNDSLAEWNKGKNDEQTT